jgi:hypothetical protein
MFCSVNSQIAQLFDFIIVTSPHQPPRKGIQPYYTYIIHRRDQRDQSLPNFRDFHKKFLQRIKKS